MIVSFRCSIINKNEIDNHWDIEVDISEGEYARLNCLYGTDIDFSKCTVVSDIYKKVFKIADESATGMLNDYDENFYLLYDKDKTLKASDFYTIKVDLIDKEEKCETTE